MKMRDILGMAALYGAAGSVLPTSVTNLKPSPLPAVEHNPSYNPGIGCYVHLQYKRVKGKWRVKK